MVLASRCVHTGGKSEAQLTKKQAVLLMHDIYMIAYFYVSCVTRTWTNIYKYAY